MLLEDEKHVIKWLSQYHALLYAQVVQLLHDKTPDVADKIIRNLKREDRICDLPGGYLAIDPLVTVDDRVITAVWVLLQFIEHIEPMAHYPATYPAQIYFLKGDVGYEIVVLQDGEPHLTKLLQAEEDMKYIFVVPDAGLVNELTPPDAPCLFASVRDTGKEKPEVEFYTIQEEIK